METVAVEVRPPGEEPFPERRHELGTHRRVAMQIAMVGEPGAAPLLIARRQWRIPGAQTRGRGGVPLVEIPARRRLIEQAVAVPLFQNEPPPGTRRSTMAAAVRVKSAMWCIDSEATTASNGPGSVKSSNGMRRKSGPSGATGSTATMSYPAAAIAEVRSPTGPQPISRTRAGRGGR